jgi:copper oxidase (laccase) domain-containing protein
MSKTTFETLIVPDIHPGVAIAESGRGFGNMHPKFDPTGGEAVLDARFGLRATIDANYEEAFVLRPKGGTTFVDVDSPREGDVMEEHSFLEEIEVDGDGLITTRPNRVLMLNSADCIAATIFDPNHSVLALAHLGWSGAAGGLHRDMMDYMTDRYGFNPKTAHVYLASSVHADSYVKKGISDVQRSQEWAPFVLEHDDGFHVNVLGFTLNGLVVAGIPASNIKVSHVDTGATPEYFSHVRHTNLGETAGRNGCVAMMLDRSLDGIPGPLEQSR